MSGSPAWTPRVVGSFDRLAWRQSLRGALRGLSGAEWAVLWFAYDRADGMGQVDLPREYLAEEMGLSVASVKRAMRRLAGELGLLERVKSRAGRVGRYQLAVPAAGLSASGVDEAVSAAGPGGRDEAGSLSISRGITGGESCRVPRSEGVKSDPLDSLRGSNLRPRGGQICAPEGVTGDPQSRIQSRDKAAAADAGERARSPGLFDRPGFDRAAAAILVSAGLGNRRTAAALVARYGVSRLEARNIRSNLRAARRAGVSVHNAAGWVRSAVQRGEVTQDQRVRDGVAAWRDKLRRRRERAERAAEASREARAASESADRRRAAEERLRAMSEAEREALRSVVTAGLEAGGGGGGLTFRPNAAMVRDWMVDELVKQIESEVDDGD